MAPVIEKVLDGFTLAEGPHWDEKTQCLYFLDMTQSTIHRYVPATKKHTKVTFAKITGKGKVFACPEEETQLFPSASCQCYYVVAPENVFRDFDPNESNKSQYIDNNSSEGQKDEFVVTLDRSIVLIHWDGENDTAKIIKKLFEVEQGTNHVFNDGKCDKTGRIWTGTMATQATTVDALVDNQGSFYSFQNEIKLHRSGVGISNGIAFDYKRNKMYYIDSLRKSMDQYDIDFETGTLSNKTIIFSNEKNGFKEDWLLDGMTIDTDGKLWVAVFGSSRVFQINPRIPDTVIQSIELPAKQITSVTFGGPNLDDLYVTSANVKDRLPGKDPGSLFRITGLNVKGFPADEAVL